MRRHFKITLMSKKKIYFTVLLIFIAAALAAALDAPAFLNGGINAFNAPLKNFVGLQLPHFPEMRFYLGLDLQGGTRLLYQADLSRISSENYSEAMSGLRDVIERRINFFGVTEPLVQTEQAGGRWRLVVELAGVKDINQAIKMIGQTPLLEFREARSEDETKQILEKQKNGQTLDVDPYFTSTQLTGQYLKRASLEFDQTTGKPRISLEFNNEGAKIFEDITAQNIKKPLAIYVDNYLLEAPVVQDKITGGKAQITGEFTVEAAKSLARNLNAGALPVPITLISQQTIGPSLGAVSMRQSLKAGIIAAILVVAFVILFYRLPGILAAIALGIYLLFMLAIFKLIPVTLTMAGIGGTILSIGMAVDANILIFSRMREEFATGKSFAQVISEGFSRAWPSIRDGNLTTLIIAGILFYFGTSFVKGFALTLSLGIIVSIFSAMFITRHFLKVFEGTRFEKWQWLWR